MWVCVLCIFTICSLFISLTIWLWHDYYPQFTITMSPGNNGLVFKQFCIRCCYKNIQVGGRRGNSNTCGWWYGLLFPHRRHHHHRRNQHDRVFYWLAFYCKAYSTSIFTTATNNFLNVPCQRELAWGKTGFRERRAIIIIAIMCSPVTKEEG